MKKKMMMSIVLLSLSTHAYSGFFGFGEEASAGHCREKRSALTSFFEGVFPFMVDTNGPSPVALQEEKNTGESFFDQFVGLFDACLGKERKKINEKKAAIGQVDEYDQLVLKKRSRPPLSLESLARKANGKRMQAYEARIQELTAKGQHQEKVIDRLLEQNIGLEEALQERIEHEKDLLESWQEQHEFIKAAVRSQNYEAFDEERRSLERSLSGNGP